MKGFFFSASSCSRDTGTEAVFCLRLLIHLDFELPFLFVAAFAFTPAPPFPATLCFPLSVNISHWLTATFLSSPWRWPLICGCWGMYGCGERQAADWEWHGSGPRSADCTQPPLNQRFAVQSTKEDNAHTQAFFVKDTHTPTLVPCQTSLTHTLQPTTHINHHFWGHKKDVLLNLPSHCSQVENVHVSGGLSICHTSHLYC